MNFKKHFTLRKIAQSEIWNFGKNKLSKRLKLSEHNADLFFSDKVRSRKNRANPNHLLTIE